MTLLQVASAVALLSLVREAEGQAGPCLSCAAGPSIHSVRPVVVEVVYAGGGSVADTPPVFPLFNYMPAWTVATTEIYIYDCVPEAPARGYFPNQGSLIPAGSTVRVTCPCNAENKPCDVILTQYHCPACSNKKNGGWPSGLPGVKGWGVGSCAPRMTLRTGDIMAWPMLAYQKLVPAGTTENIEVTDPLENFALFTRQCAVDCHGVDPAGPVPDECTCDANGCRSAWCPPRPKQVLVPQPCEADPGCAPSNQ